MNCTFQHTFSKSKSMMTNTNYMLCSQNIGSKDANMVLQLVVPCDGKAQNCDRYYDNSYVIEPAASGDFFDSSTTSNNNLTKYDSKDECITSGSDIYAPSSIHIGSINENKLGLYNNYGLVPKCYRSDLENCMDEERIRSTSKHEKEHRFREHLTCILSSMYALFVVTLGLVVYISDVVIGNSPIAETFSLYLVVVALVFILYLIFDIKKLRTDNQHCENTGLPKTSNYPMNIRVPAKRISNHYCLSKERYSANFYLKLGATVFCIGHLIHSGLIVGYQILFLASDENTFYECATVTTLVLDIVYPIYSFFLLYFIFKYSNVVINRHLALVRFGLMHCIGSSLCFWIWTILRETIESLSNHEFEQHSIVSTEMPEIAFSEIGTAHPMALPLRSYNRKGAELLTTYLNSSIRYYNNLCRNEDSLALIYRNYSPYLYPFSVEYSILVVGVLFVVWQSIGKCWTDTRRRRKCNLQNNLEAPNRFEGNLVLHADCHAANKGLFGGIVIMSMTMVSVILFFIAFNDTNLTSIGIFVNIITSITIMALMLIAGTLAYRQITKLDVNKNRVPLLDDLLLFVCIPAFFLNGIFTIIPAVLATSTLSISFVVLEIGQVLVQTPLIIDGLRRSSNSKNLQIEKPGRELLTFLIVCNVAMWITQTFEVKSYGLQDHRYEFYGRELWTIISHMCIPLMMFYRFHSSVCLVDIWKYAYKPSTPVRYYCQ